MRYIIFLSLVPLLFACDSANNTKPVSRQKMDAEQFVKLPFTDFNKNLLIIGHFIQPEEVLKRYRRIDLEMEPLEGKETVDVSSRKIGEGKYEVTLIHDFLADHSVKSEKYIMRIFRRKDIWQVYTLQKNWKCWEGRGHQEWGIGQCK